MTTFSSVAFATDNNAEASTPTALNTQKSTENTTVTLKENSTTLYVKSTCKIKATITSGKGKTTYTSSNKKVAKVTKSGTVKALKKGTAKITVTNNKVSAIFKVKVKNPKLNAKSATLTKGKTFKIKITGKVGKATFKSAAPSIAKVSKSGKIKAVSKGTTSITVKTNGKIKLKFKVKVQNTSKWNLVKTKLTFKKTKDTLKANVGEGNRTLPFEASLSSNVFDLYYKGKITYKQYTSFSKRIKTEAKNVTISIADSSIGKLNTKSYNIRDEKAVRVKPLKKGNTKITVKYDDKSFTIDYKVTKHNVFTFNGKTSKAVYSVDEAAKVIKEDYDNNLFKGENPQYYFVVCYFDVNDKEKTYETVNNKIDESIVLFSYYGFDKKYIDGDTEIYYFDGTPEEELLAKGKKLYKEATSILNSINISSYKTDYEKVLAVSKWMKSNCVYENTSFNYAGFHAYNIIIDHKGVCFNWAAATTYFCKLLNIPCYGLSSDTHSWNVVQIQGKWYHLDILWGLHFLGTNTILNYSDHNFKYSKTAEAYWEEYYPHKITIEDNDFVIPKTE